MWTAPVLLWILGGAALWVPAQAGLEDSVVTTSVGAGEASPGREDHIPTTSGSEAPRLSPSLTTRVPAATESRTLLGVTDVSTPGSSTQSRQKSQTTATPPVAMGTSAVDVTKSTEIGVDKDGLSTGSLPGIVIGVLIIICALGLGVCLFVRKMSK